jgi:hypothetical protein
MDPASLFILLLVGVVGAGFVVFLFLTGAGLELREGRRGFRRRRPKHARVENEQHAVSSPVRSETARSSSPDRRPRPEAE